MRALRNFLVRLFLLITVIGILFGVVFGLTPMANADMQPAVCAGDLMLYYRLDKNLKSDDVVVFQKEDIQYTGRIVAVPGDVVEITDESELMVNKNTVMEDNIFYTTPAYDSEVEYPLALKEDQYFILCGQLHFRLSHIVLHILLYPATYSHLILSDLLCQCKTSAYLIRYG